MKKLLITYAFCLVSTFINGQHSDGLFSIKGQVPNDSIFDSIDELMISRIEADESFKQIASIPISPSGQFKWQAKFEQPILYRLEAPGLKHVTLVIDRAEEVSVKFLLSEDGEGQMSLEGSSGNNQVTWFQNQLEQLQVTYFDDLKPQMEQALAQKDETKIQALQEEVARLFPLFVDDLHKAVDKLGITAAAYSALKSIDANKGIHIIESITQKFQEEAPNWIISQIVSKRLAAIKGLAIGTLAPSFKLPDMKGQEIGLSDFRGQYVLLDFWASWCLACRAENPKWESLYQEYHKKGLVILGIGVKDEIERWNKAIVKDGLTYPQLSALDSDVPNLYFVSSLPQNVLLDKEGIIVAKNLKYEGLKSWLESHFIE